MSERRRGFDAIAWKAFALWMVLFLMFSLGFDALIIVTGHSLEDRRLGNWPEGTVVGLICFFSSYFASRGIALNWERKKRAQAKRG